MADNIYGRVFDASTSGWIADLIINTPTGIYVKEASLGTDFAWINGLLDVSIQGAVTDPSITDLYNYANDLSTNKADLTDLYPYVTNASVGLALDPYATNSSVGLAIQDFATNSSVNGAGFIKSDSLNPFATNSSVGDALKPYATNASVGNANFLKEASLGTKFYWDVNGLEPSSGSGDVTKLYVDGSLAERDVSIDWLNQNKQATGSYLESFSLSNTIEHSLIEGNYTTYSVLKGLNASTNIIITEESLFGPPGGSVLTISTSAPSKAYVDGSIAPFATNASVGTAIAPFATNASVGTAIQNFSTNASVNTALGAYATNASIGTAAFAKNASFNLYATNSSVGTAIAPFATNASVGTALGAYTTNASANTAFTARDASLNNTTDITTLFVRNASLGTHFKWDTSLLDVSIGEYTLKTYVDGSLSSRDTSINRIDGSVNTLFTYLGLTANITCDGSLLGFVNGILKTIS
jgi:hypothetical protein